MVQYYFTDRYSISLIVIAILHYVSIDYGVKPYSLLCNITEVCDIHRLIKSVGETLLNPV